MPLNDSGVTNHVADPPISRQTEVLSPENSIVLQNLGKRLVKNELSLLDMTAEAGCKSRVETCYGRVL